MSRFKLEICSGPLKGQTASFREMRGMADTLRDIAKDYDIALVFSKPDNASSTVPGLEVGGVWMTWFPVGLVTVDELRGEIVKRRDADISVESFHFDYTPALEDTDGND